MGWDTKGGSSEEMKQRCAPFLRNSMCEGPVVSVCVGGMLF
jgi:hypothetical protein